MDNLYQNITVEKKKGGEKKKKIKEVITDVQVLQ